MTGSFFSRLHKTQQTKFEVQCSTRERLNNPISFEFLLVSYSTNYACGYSNRKQKVKKAYYHSAVNYIIITQLPFLSLRKSERNSP